MFFIWTGLRHFSTKLYFSNSFFFFFHFTREAIKRRKERTSPQSVSSLTILVTVLKAHGWCTAYTFFRQLWVLIGLIYRAELMAAGSGGVSIRERQRGALSRNESHRPHGCWVSSVVPISQSSRLYSPHSCFYSNINSIPMNWGLDKFLLDF